MTTRARISVLPPGGAGTMVRSGVDWARAMEGNARSPVQSILQSSRRCLRRGDTDFYPITATGCLDLWSMLRRLGCSGDSKAYDDSASTHPALATPLFGRHGFGSHPMAITAF